MNTLLRKYSPSLLTAVIYAVLVSFALVCSLELI